MWKKSLILNMELKFGQFKFVEIKFFRNGFELLKYLTCEGLLFKSKERYNKTFILVYCKVETLRLFCLKTFLT
jgi:hypothetical protein